MCALGIDPDTDTRFVKDGHTLLTQLARFRQVDGTYSHTLEGAGDGMATEQSVLALVAVQRVHAGQPWVLHFDGTYTAPDVPVSPDTQTAQTKAGADRTILYVRIGAAVVIAAGAICIIVRKRRKA